GLPVDPAYIVTLACYASGIVTLGLCVLMQVRLGVNPWVASALVLALTCHPRIWLNIIEPEVYAPAMALLAASAYLLIRYAVTGGRMSLYLAALLFGMTLANRPTVIWIAPFFCLAWWLARGRWDSSTKDWHNQLAGSWRVFARVALLAIVPGLYSLAFILVRDTPDATYNYIESYNAEFHELPEADAGWRAKGERLWWLVTAHEFRRYLVESPRDARMRLRWLYLEFFLFRTVTFLGAMFLTGPYLVPMVAVIAAGGGTLLWRKSRPGFCLLVGMVLGNIGYICTYRVYELAGDLSPLMFAFTVIAGVAVSSLIPLGAKRWRRATAVVLAATAGLLMSLDAPIRSERESPDAIAFLTEVDMATLPKDAVICSIWSESTALWYAQNFLTRRPDIEIINAGETNWYSRVAEKTNRPIFMTFNPPRFEGQDISPYRNLWRWRNPKPISP
ncbi:MAG: hypothetical protein IID33_03760, partial [Planctomycetes bacterium]|nr:hypothetical protein [Planctomycetota bacterium]